MRVAFVLVGESFRLGTQGSRDTGSVESFESQKAASETHRRLIDGLPGSHDVYIHTCPTAFEQDLLGFYGHVAGHAFDSSDIHDIGGRCQKAFEMVSGRVDEYDHVFFMRIDLKLKDFFLDLFWRRVTVTADKVMFPSICWLQMWRTSGGYPRISDTMALVPKRYFDVLKTKQFLLGHDTWEYLAPLGVEMDVFVYTLHDSDSNKDWNPSYMMCSRPEAPQNESHESYVFDLATLSIFYP